MASIVKRSDRYEVAFGPRKQRQTLRGFVYKATAVAVKKQIEALADIVKRGDEPAGTLARWVDTLSDKDRVKLARVGLLSERHLLAAEPLGAHLKAFRADVGTKMIRGRRVSSKRVTVLEQRVKLAFDTCGFTRWLDVDQGRVHQFLVSLSEGGKAELTVRGYCQALQQFAEWMMKSRRAARNPLADLQARDYGTEVESERRAFDSDELRYLMAATVAGPMRRGMDGLERALLYLLAIETGLRVAELCSLTVRNFELDGDAPLVWLHRQNTKNKRRAELPLRTATAALLKQRFAHKAPTAAAFPVLPRPDAFAKLFRQDLTAARQQWIQEANGPVEREKR
jgi:site-specific recombinase XerC